MSPSDETSRSDGSSVGIGAWAIVCGFMGCRIVPLRIEVGIINFEGDDEKKESVEFIRSWSKKKKDMRYQKKKK